MPDVINVLQFMVVRAPGVPDATTRRSYIKDELLQDGKLIQSDLYYNETRTHLGLGKDAPLRRAVERSGTIVATPTLPGLHHRYARI